MQKFDIYAIGCTEPETYYNSIEKASDALKKKAEELNERWNTHSLFYNYRDHKLEVITGFEIQTGGWDDQTICWKLLTIPVC